jgi:hypothetical protein
MRKDQKLKRLKLIQGEADGLRRELGISAPGAVLYQSPLRALEDEMVIVEANGFGGAAVYVVDGNFPVDFITKFERRFVSEEDAIRAAERLVDRKAELTMA